MEQNEKKPIILLVEDSEEDYYTTKRAFSKAGLANELHRVKDGAEALAYLFSEAPFDNEGVHPTPNVILLDLNLPKIDGTEVLKKIKSDDKLKKIPVVVLTSSSDPKDIDMCYQLGANSYMQKPVSLESFIEALKRFREYWFEIIILPKEG